MALPDVDVETGVGVQSRDEGTPGASQEAACAAPRGPPTAPELILREP